jgi:DNA-binding IclR family transcriptional regulator
MTMAGLSTYRLVHRLRADEAADILRYSSRLTLALAILDDAHPMPVTISTFTAAFACAPPETSGVLGRLRALGLAERLDDHPATYCLTPKGVEARDRIAALLATATAATPTAA